MYYLTNRTQWLFYSKKWFLPFLPECSVKDFFFNTRVSRRKNYYRKIRYFKNWAQAIIIWLQKNDFYKGESVCDRISEVFMNFSYLNALSYVHSGYRIFEMGFFRYEDNPREPEREESAKTSINFSASSVTVLPRYVSPLRIFSRETSAQASAAHTLQHRTRMGRARLLLSYMRWKWIDLNITDLLDLCDFL